MTSGTPIARRPSFNSAKAGAGMRTAPCVEAADPRFDPAAVRGLLAQTCPLSLTEVAG